MKHHLPKKKNWCTILRKQFDIAGAAVQKLMMKIEKEQEVLMNIADMAIETFDAESVLLRVMKLVDKVAKLHCNLQGYYALLIYMMQQIE